MNERYREWMIDHYNKHVLGEIDGAQLEKTRDTLAHEFLDALERGDLPQEEPDLDYARGVFRSVVEPERTRRRASFKKQAEYLLDAIRNPEEGVHVEPFLDVAYPLGTADGRDKAFRYWNEEDFRTSVIERYRNAAAAMEAAKQHDDVAQEWIDTIRVRGAVMVGDCFVKDAAS